MRHLLAFALLLLALTIPAAADWRADATTLTWFTAPGLTADRQQLYDAMLWKYRGIPLDGLLAAAAYPQIAITSLGGGNSEVSITLPLAVGNNWVLNLVALPCPTANTTTLRRACADPMVKSDLMTLWRQYRQYLLSINGTCAAIVAEPPAL